MATTPDRPAPTGSSLQQDLPIYGHSALFYWWPVWFVGFIMTLLTYLDGHRMAVVPNDWDEKIAKASRTWQVEIQPGQMVTREGIIIVDPNAHLPPTKPAQAGGLLPEPDQPHIHMASSKTLGVVFSVTLLLVIFVSNVQL